MADLRVSLPNPCGEPWEGMTPSGCNRHCASCDRMIHDLHALTFNEAEALLESGEGVCVRATIGKGGVVKLADSARSKRRMIAAVGASMALATAACQTVPHNERANRFSISGTLPIGPTKPIVRSSDGRTWPVRIDPSNATFRAAGLYPGVYSITYRDPCGGEERVIEQITVRDQSVDLGQQLWSDDCIIIGVMMPLDRAGRG